MADARVPALHKLAYERAAAVLDHQRARLSEIRTNSSILLAATALVASFLGDWSLDKGEGTFGVLALGTFVLGILCGIAPVWPVIQAQNAGLRGLLSHLLSPRAAKRLTGNLTWGRGPSAREILAMTDVGTATAYARVAAALGDCAAENDSIINRRSAWVVACGLLLAAQVVLWVGNALAQN
jgi:hypothetical protein